MENAALVIRVNILARGWTRNPAGYGPWLLRIGANNICYVT